MLRLRQLLVGGALLLFEPRDRLARFALARLEPLALLFGAAPLDLEELELLLHLLQVVGRPLQLHLEADDGLLFAMQIGIHGRERVRHLGDARFERRDVRHGLIALGFFAGDAIAQLLDFALDAENGASFVLAAARHEHPSAHDIAGQRRDAAPTSIRTRATRRARSSAMNPSGMTASIAPACAPVMRRPNRRWRSDRPAPRTTSPADG